MTMVQLVYTIGRMKLLLAITEFLSSPKLRVLSPPTYIILCTSSLVRGVSFDLGDTLYKPDAPKTTVVHVAQRSCLHTLRDDRTLGQAS